MLDEIHCWFFFFFIDFIYLFLERGEGREKERERNINVWLLLMCPPSGAWLGIKLATLWFLGQCSIHSATPARAPHWFLWRTHLTDSGGGSLSQEVHHSFFLLCWLAAPGDHFLGGSIIYVLLCCKMVIFHLSFPLRLLAEILPNFFRGHHIIKN